jgi:hypothetical protein
MEIRPLLGGRVFHSTSDPLRIAYLNIATELMHLPGLHPLSAHAFAIGVRSCSSLAVSCSLALPFPLGFTRLES